MLHRHSGLGHAAPDNAAIDAGAGGIGIVLDEFRIVHFGGEGGAGDAARCDFEDATYQGPLVPRQAFR